VDTRWDPANCGTCARACAANQTCVTGTCATVCAAGITLCPSGCVNLTNDAANCGRCGNACAAGATCVGGTCTTPGLSVAIIQGSWWTDDLRAYLATQAPIIRSVTTITNCSLATLRNYDVVIVYGNMPCMDNAAFTAYVNEGHGMVATPWIYQNNGGFDALPLSRNSGSPVFGATVNITVTNPGDVLLTGVGSFSGNTGYENWTYSVRSGATTAAHWAHNAATYAVARRDYGSGRTVFLNFHYITSDCTRAISYAWGQRLMMNAIQWAGRRL
jgi:hypothetical protein